ncbi:MAG: ATP-binding cassette domain-containing protein [Paludibacteraceae bacterium]|nr:ATP-binding cassette domain-containing protein [Paludibacteraceae bacterium]
MSLIKYTGVDICHQEQTILKDVNLDINEGEFIYLLGKVGSGKSTLIKTMYADIPISAGEATIFDYNLRKIKRRQIPYLRRKLGIVFQDFQLLTDRSVQQNLLFVLRATGWKDNKMMKEQVEQVLDQVGMKTKAYKMPHQLSGGEQQRIVIARALLNSPQIILADEPTGNLDPETGRELLELLHAIRQSGTTILMATHNQNWVKQYPARKLLFNQGHIEEIE